MFFTIQYDTQFHSPTSLSIVTSFALLIIMTIIGPQDKHFQALVTFDGTECRDLLSLWVDIQDLTAGSSAMRCFWE